ncbi:hypothetical protein AAVH_04969 [Aphelenchoides avenae]|nr:hypothetical protein AAVH_04969 [Aphelenchus avenae]
MYHDPSETETAVSMHVVINENLNEVYDGEPEVGEYVDRPNPKKKKKIGNRRRDHVIIEGRPKADHAIIERVAKKKGNMKADHVIIDMDDKPPSRN